MLFTIIVAIHVIAVVLWIGGLAYVTMVIFPSMYKMEKPLEKILFFQSAEHRFAPFARIYSIVVGLSGLFMVHLLYRGDFLSILDGKGIFIVIMFSIWVLWVIMLFGLEKVVIKKLLDNLAKSPDKLKVDVIFKRMNIFHWFMLLLSITAILCGTFYQHLAL
jgi:uncharacterized membrane protein